MRIESRKEGRIHVIRPLETRLDASVAVDFTATMSQVFRNEGCFVLLNLDSVDFIDSFGLGAIISTLNSHAGGKNLAICGAKSSVENLFKLTLMDRVLPIYTSETDAVAALSQAPAHQN